MNSNIFITFATAAFAILGASSNDAQATEFDPSCFYNLDAKPNWPAETAKAPLIPVGVTMTSSGALVRLVPRKALKQKLKATQSRNEWITLFASAPRQSFKIHNRRKATGTPLDLKIDTQAEVIFRLFKKDWHFAEKAFTTGYEIPVLANGFITHHSPFYVLKSPVPDKLAIMGYYVDPSRITNPKCKYKYDLNLDITTNGFTTRVIIDPEVEADGPIQ